VTFVILTAWLLGAAAVAPAQTPSTSLGAGTVELAPAPRAEVAVAALRGDLPRLRERLQ
jgi:hypothetical protein